ncbi:MAG: Rid family hydrolase [Candidatus Devosia symbiotica]|nr:Rid family hydrolase [Candidatus Devosia symbiotica]
MQRVSTGSPVEVTFGYSYVVRHEDTVYVSGTTGYAYATMTMLDNVGQQAGNALATIDKALKEADSSIQDTVRVVYIWRRPRRCRSSGQAGRRHGL